MAFIVIGGGIVGLCTAWSAAKRGYDVELYEQGPIPQLTSASACHNPILLARYGASPTAQRFSALAEQSWKRVWHQTRWHHTYEIGVLVLAKTSPKDQSQTDLADLAPSHRSAATMEQSGRSVTWHSRQTLAQQYPFLNWQDRAGAYQFGSAVMLDGSAFLDHLYQQIIHMGVRVYQHTPVHALHLQERQIHFGDGWYEIPDACFIASGPWFGDLIPNEMILNNHFTYHIESCQSLVLKPPLEQIFNWQKTPILIDGDVAQQQFMYAPPLGGQGLQISPLLFPPFNRPSEIGKTDLCAIDNAVDNRLLQYTRYQTSQTISSYEIFSDDHRPLILPLSDNWPAYAVTGTSGQGFMLAPLLAEITLDMMTRTETNHLQAYTQYKA